MINRKKSIENHQKVLKDAQLLYNDVEVNKIISDIGKAITNELKTSNPIVMPVMIGGLVFAGKLIQKLDFPLQIDYIHATRYSGDTHGGKLNWLKKPDKPLSNETILLVDDILDEGITLSEIIKYCYSKGAKKVFSAVLVEKILDHKKPIRDVDFVGFTIPNVYVFGYGMDYYEYHRNAAGIYAVRKS